MAIEFVNSTTYLDQFGTVNISFDVGNKNNTVLVVCNTFRDGAGGKSTQSVTYNGVSATKLTGDGTGGFYVDIWYLFNPNPGTNTLSINTGISSGANGGIAIMSFSGVNTNILPQSAVNTGNSALITGSITPSKSKSLVVDVCRIQRSSMICGQTQVLNRKWSDGGDYLTGSSYKLNQTGTSTLTWTPNGSSSWATYLASFSPVEAGGAFLYHLI